VLGKVGKSVGNTFSRVPSVIKKKKKKKKAIL
jgi:hypothetical protein